MIQIERVILHHVHMPLKNPFTNSLTTVTDKDLYIIELVDQDGIRGYGETVAFDSPWYTEETTETTRVIMEQHLIPALQSASIVHPNDLVTLFQHVRRHQMAKAAIETAVWDLYAKRQRKPLYEVIGGVRSQIPVGATIGMQATDQHLLEKMQSALNQGYQRIKLKVSPQHDLHTLELVRQHYPDLPLMVDANSAYRVENIDHLKKFDEYQLMMIEQPFAPHDFVDHAKLQEKLKTPICLDESIHTLADAKTAIALHSCQVMSIKLGKVGGFTHAIQIHDYCAAHHIPVWCGGMLEAGVGRLQSLALATLENFRFPADPGASSRYWHQDIIDPEVTVENGHVQLSKMPGIGREINWDVLEQYRIQQIVHQKSTRLR
ncbi:O-succinylbenzoate-CoA synthase [Gracilibacillus halophilus YIM-C55.5]|uniref:o-succinylbenzoate synthase n=1 Tax=Gracilibacillus halophilus YIM-C55.5 TaxID=1308866 RepID=N4WBJ7_9BACI|nr:o-succinylbenzoate synthase [Gracilibacillus halophilus]ENH97663.1 O-succinylbenzoate-CoA synthase [Gracilibacillus halophilus YIM-C55.5]